MTKPPGRRYTGNSGSATKARAVWTDHTEKLLVDILEKSMSGRTAPFEIGKIKEELIERTQLSQRVVNDQYPKTIEKYLGDKSINLEMRIRMTFFSKAAVTEELNNEMLANGVPKLVDNKSTGQNKLKKFVSSNPAIASVPEQVPQSATRNRQASGNHVIIPPNDLYANSTVAFHANAQMNTAAYHDNNVWDYSFHSPYATSSQHLPPHFYPPQNPYVPVNDQLGYVAPTGQSDPNFGFDGPNAGNFAPQYMGNYTPHSHNFSAPNHFAQDYYVHPTWAMQHDRASNDPPRGTLLDLDSSARRPNERGIVDSAVSAQTQAQVQNMVQAPPNPVQQPALRPTTNEIEGACNPSFRREAASLPRASEVPANDAPPSKVLMKTEIKQDPDGAVAATKGGAVGGSERRCKKTRAEESAKATTPLPAPARTAYQFMYEFLHIFEGFKGDNPFIKEFMKTLLETTKAKKNDLEKKTLPMEIVEYIINVALNESIQKANILELESDLVLMEEEQIPLNTFILKLKSFVNLFVALSPVMAALAQKMDKVLEEGISKGGDIVDAGKLGITATQVVKCLKFAKDIHLSSFSS